MKQDEPAVLAIQRLEARLAQLEQAHAATLDNHEERLNLAEHKIHTLDSDLDHTNRTVRDLEGDARSLERKP